MARPRNISARKSLLTQSGSNLHVAMRGSLYDVQSQIRQNTQVIGYRDNRRPTGLKENDITVRPTRGGVAVGISDADGNIQEAILSSEMSDLSDFQQGSGPPTLDNFPDNGDWGQYYDTVAGALYWVRNLEGTLVYLNFVGFAGTISDTQHGDRSTTTTTMHKFAQITGTITDTQHGSRGGGNLHDNATGSTAGFMSSADKTKLDAATSSDTASTLVLRNGSGGASFAGTLTGAIINATTDFRVDGTKVVGNRETGWSNWTGTISRVSHATYTAPTISATYSQAQVQAIADSLQDVTRAMFGLLTDLGTAGHGLLSS